MSFTHGLIVQWISGTVIFMKYGMVWWVRRYSHSEVTEPMVLLISVYLAVTQISAKAARVRTRSHCIAWCVCLAHIFRFCQLYCLVSETVRWYRLAYGLITVAGVELMLTQTQVRCPTLCHKAPRADGPIIYNGSVKQFQIVVDDILQIFNIFSLCKLLC